MTRRMELNGEAERYTFSTEIIISVKIEAAQIFRYLQTHSHYGIIK